MHDSTCPAPASSATLERQPLTRRLGALPLARGTLSTAALIAGCLVLGCGDEGEATPRPPTTVRKSASALTVEEIDRFRRAYEYAVGHGFFDAFNDEHYDHHKHRHHGQDVLASSPMAVMASHGPAAGYRLLPWHRAFIQEAEMMLRAALRERDAAEGRSVAEAELLFIPYWDAAHDQGLPPWVLDFQPQGGTAEVPPDLPEGHAGYGKPVGDRYDIVFHRWPGANISFDKLHEPDQVGRILAHSNFDDFYTALDVSPEVVSSQLGVAQTALVELSVLRPEDESVQILVRAAETPPSTPEEQLAVTNALLAVGYLAAVEQQADVPNAALIDAIEDVYSLFRFMPHLLMHLWAGGLDPANPALRGTVTYFQELAVDPVFWMLHTELDRYWYTWERSNSEKPPLEGVDAIFQPLSSERGSWYGGGEVYELDALTALDELPYTYDMLFEVSPAGLGAEPALAR